MEIEFVRFGGLSKVNHKKARRLKKDESYHVAPVNKGIYAFIFPYIEGFLWTWKIDTSKLVKEMDADDLSLAEREVKHKKFFKSEYRRLRKKFKYKGYIWTHFTDLARKYRIGVDYSGEWVKVHTNDLPFLLKKDKHETMRYHDGDIMLKSVSMVDPYKRGLGGYYSRDHLEVFIEKVN